MTDVEQLAERALEPAAAYQALRRARGGQTDG